MQNKATDLFSEWAKIGRDQGMAKAHNPAVSEILSTVLAGREKAFSFTSDSVVMSKSECGGFLKSKGVID